jgi:hypothetical protein
VSPKVRITTLLVVLVGALAWESSTGAKGEILETFSFAGEVDLLSAMPAIGLLAMIRHKLTTIKVDITNF